MNLLTEFHESRTINVASRVKNVPPIGNKSSDHISRRLKINVASRVSRRKNAPPPGGHVFFTKEHHLWTRPRYYWDESSDQVSSNWTINEASRVKNVPPRGSHAFQAKVTIFELIQVIIGTNLLTKFNEDWKINVASREKCPAPGSHVFQSTGIIFELVQDIIKMNLLTKFHEDWTIKGPLEKNAPPLGSHVFQANFHEDRKINVASRVKNAPPPGGHIFQPTSIIF
ncbi:hypothetical protein DPMN_160039 [Dreissena polymorpha]|uniref:Uncharacterized protein n=1 Tax=Dreissena polymorpha TaxID=45954 RepID=A0A9D4EMR0_DREPO|nr:hypothetical protein DPMN_160039 [Dreissena polymorpha]